MPRFAANLSMLFTEQDFLARFKAAADAGFSGVEYLFPYDFSAAEIKQQLDANGLTQVLFNLPAGDWAKGDRGIACDPGRVEEFRAGVDLAIAYAKVLGNTQVNCLAGIRPQGPDCATVKKTFIDNLKYAADKGLGVIVMEPLRGGRLADQIPDRAARIFAAVFPRRSPADWGLRWLFNQPEVIF